MKINTNNNNYCNALFFTEINVHLWSLFFFYVCWLKNPINKIALSYIYFILILSDFILSLFVDFHVPGRKLRIPLVQRAWESSQLWSNFAPKISVLFPIISCLTCFFNLGQLRTFSFAHLKDERHTTSHFETVLL